MKLSLLLLLSILATTSLELGVVICEDAKTFACSFPNSTLLNGNSGKLTIAKSNKTCSFSTPKTTSFFALNTADLTLEANDKLSLVSASDSSKKTELTPPFGTGFLVSGLQNPNVTFSFSNLDGPSMEVNFMMNQSSIPINGDINNEIHIRTVELKSLNIQFDKTIDDLVYFEVSGASIKNGVNPKYALLDNSTTISLDLVASQVVTIRTSPALRNCSQTYTATRTNETYSLESPPPQKDRESYKCVNLFTKTPDTTFVVDFKDFVDVVDDEDQLILDNGRTDSSLFIVKADASEYTGQVKYFNGNNLAVIYDSPRIVHPNNIQFELKVRVSENVNIVEKAQQSLRLSTPVKYVLRPQREEYASIQSSTPDLKGNTVTVSSGRDTKTTLTAMPPVLALNNAGSQMILEYNSKTSAGSFDYKPLKSSCHHLSSATSDGYSVTNVIGQCFWTIAPSEPVLLKFDYVHLQNGCLTLVSLPGKPMFSRCNLDSTDVLPPFVISQGYVNITLSSNTSRLDATISRSPTKALNNVPLSKSINLTSSNYPVTYAYSNQNSNYILNTTGKSFALTLVDLDLRSGENMLIGKTQINEKNRLTTGMIDISNKVTTIQINRSAVSNDFSNRRGFKLQADQFDKIIEADKSPFRTPANLTSVLLRISTSKLTTDFGKRIRYNMTFASASQGYDVSIIDSRVLNGRQISISKFHNQTTSDTLLVRYVATKPGTMLPVATLEFSFMDCNKTTDHVCDNNTRCVPKESFCYGAPYCEDKSDLKYCSGTALPVPEPKIIETGVGGVTVFLLSIMMLVLGALSALYGPDLVRNLEARFRSGQYTTFTSSD